MKIFHFFSCACVFLTSVSTRIFSILKNSIVSVWNPTGKNAGALMGTKLITVDVWILICVQTFCWLTTSTQSCEFGQLLMSSNNLHEIIVCISRGREGLGLNPRGKALFGWISGEFSVIMGKALGFCPATLQKENQMHFALQPALLLPWIWSQWVHVYIKHLETLNRFFLHHEVLVLRLHSKRLVRIWALRGMSPGNCIYKHES